MASFATLRAATRKAVEERNSGMIFKEASRRALKSSFIFEISLTSHQSFFTSVSRARRRFSRLAFSPDIRQPGLEINKGFSPVLLLLL
jgi:hypothetical protein